MTWYRALFFYFFSYFKTWSDNDERAASNAGLLLLMLHILNLITIVHLVSVATGKLILPYSWAKEWALPLIALVLAYSWYFVSLAGRIADEFSEKQRVVAIARIAGLTYIGLSVIGMGIVFCL